MYTTVQRFRVDLLILIEVLKKQLVILLMLKTVNHDEPIYVFQDPQLLNSSVASNKVAQNETLT